MCAPLQPIHESRQAGLQLTPMKSIIAISLLSSLVASAQDSTSVVQPPWLRLKITEYQRLPPFSPPRSILRANFEGKTVYYVSPACCDIPSELYDEGGSLLCYPDGGFAGGDGKCPAFTFVGNSVSFIWRDNRSKSAQPVKAPARKQ
jgi:hypothetical protein